MALHAPAGMRLASSAAAAPRGRAACAPAPAARPSCAFAVQPRGARLAARAEGGAAGGAQVASPSAAPAKPKAKPKEAKARARARSGCVQAARRWWACLWRPVRGAKACASLCAQGSLEDEAKPPKAPDAAKVPRAAAMQAAVAKLRVGGAVEGKARPRGPRRGAARHAGAHAPHRSPGGAGQPRWSCCPPVQGAHRRCSGESDRPGARS